MHDNWNDIDKLFSDKLGNMEVEPPAEVWGRVTASLDGQKGRRRGVIYFRIALAASLILALGAGWYFMEQSNKHSMPSDFVTESSLPVENSKRTDTLEKQSDLGLMDQTQKAEITHVETGFIAQHKKRNKETDSKRVQSTHIESTIHLKNEGSDWLAQMKSHNFILPSSETSVVALAKPSNSESLSDEDKAIIAANLEMLAMNNPDDRTERWSVGANVSPAYRFDGIPMMSEEKEYANFDDAFANQNNVSASYKTNVTGGLAVAYQASKKVSVQTGINYSAIEQGGSNVPVSFAGHNWIASRDEKYYSANNEYNYMAKADQLSNNVALNTNMGIANIELPEGTLAGTMLGASDIAGNTFQNYQYLQNTGYLEIPLLVRYQLVDRRLGFHLLGGLSTNLLVHNFAALSNGASIMADGRVEGLRPVTLSSSLGMGLDYEINSRIGLSIEPLMKIQLNSLNAYDGIDARPHMFGVYTGLNYRF